jgi:hypothetical protein
MSGSQGYRYDGAMLCSGQIRNSRRTTNVGNRSHRTGHFPGLENLDVVKRGRLCVDSNRIQLDLTAILVCSIIKQGPKAKNIHRYGEIGPPWAGWVIGL